MIMTKLEVTQKIIEAAVQEFMVKGLDGSSMENIAKMAEVSKRTLYKYYPNKEAIFDALVMELLETACAFPGQVYSKTETLEDQINNIVEAKAQLLTSEDYIKISRLVLSEVMKGRKMNDSQLAQFYESEKKFLKWIDAAKFLGCTAIRINLHGNGTLDQWTKGSVESLRKLSTIGKPLGIKILVENHGGFSSNGKYLSEVMRLANDSNIGTMPDFGNFCIRREVAGDLWRSPCVEQYDIYQGVAELMPYAGAFSAKSFNFDEQGNEPNINFLAMFKLMRASKYRGYVGIEYEGEKMSEDAGIRATKKLIEKVREQLSVV